jgi:hypothetical protein
LIDLSPGILFLPGTAGLVAGRIPYCIIHFLALRMVINAPFEKILAGIFQYLTFFCCTGNILENKKGR